MWEDIELINYNEIIDEIEKKAAREKEEAFREKERTIRAARKLRELGVSDELLAAAGLLEVVN